MSILSHFSRRDISHLFKTAQRVIRREECDVLLGKEKHPFGKILIVTPARIGNAARRNKVRRQCKAIFYEEKYFTQGVDCIIIVKNVPIPFEKLKAILAEAFAHRASS